MGGVGRSRINIEEIVSCDKIFVLEVDMGVVFVDVVEDVKRLSLGEKEELRDLIDSYLIEEHRDEILKNYDASKSETLECSSDINRLKELLDA